LGDSRWRACDPQSRNSFSGHPLTATGAVHALDRVLAESNIVCAREFGIDHVLAVEPEERDGRFTGGYVGTHTYQDGKVRKVEECLAARGHTLADTTTTFYSDSINDLPLLEKVDFPVVTNGDPRLLAVARERGWPMLQLFEPAHA